MNNWITPQDSSYHFGGMQNIMRFEQVHNMRKISHPFKSIKSQALTDLQDNGFAVIKNVFSEDEIQNLLSEFENALETGKCKTDPYYSTVLDPLINCPSIIQASLKEDLTNVVSSFFDCVPSLGTLNFRRSYPNPGQPVTTQIFHCDPNSVSFIKCFVYLNDVPAKEYGPLTLVPESLSKKPANWLSKYRWSEEEMKQLYGDDCLKYLTASAGDLIISRATLGFHRGTPPIVRDRTMLTLNYVIHPEEWKEPIFKMSKENYLNMTEEQKPFADFLVKV
jgi:hypothetical protein|tara:strand:- start:1408 stop:2241 length:834 start_codon:yes stop_codon:yes gene_type:complete